MHHRESGRKKEEELGTEKNDQVNLGAILQRAWL